MQVAEARGEGEAALQEKAAFSAQLQEELEALKVDYATQDAHMRSNAAALEAERGEFEKRSKDLVDSEVARVRAEEERARQYALEAVKAAHEREVARVKEDAEHLYSSKVAKLRDEVVGIFSYESDSTSRVSRSAHVDVCPDE